ncbi:hypothetical protein KC333_g43 [Hortaea werneckii]|nr:hypothetical protein KC333_g43 [Hortaea werneckii]
MASAAAKPMPSAAPVIATTFPFMLSCSNTFSGVFGVGFGSLGTVASSKDIDMMSGSCGRSGANFVTVL